MTLPTSSALTMIGLTAVPFLLLNFVLPRHGSHHNLPLAKIISSPACALLTASRKSSISVKGPFVLSMPDVSRCGGVINNSLVMDVMKRSIP